MSGGSGCWRMQPLPPTICHSDEQPPSCPPPPTSLQLKKKVAELEALQEKVRCLGCCSRPGS